MICVRLFGVWLVSWFVGFGWLFGFGLLVSCVGLLFLYFWLSSVILIWLAVLIPRLGRWLVAWLNVCFLFVFVSLTGLVVWFVCLVGLVGWLVGWLVVFNVSRGCLVD